MPDYLEFDPAIIEKRQVYRLLTGAVVPRPIGWASTISNSGVSISRRSRFSPWSASFPQ
jgi:hypothetical protein